ncbi:MAG TPA: hypothetical protein VGE07_02435 [Herpetosiphonaceae bacterium]
MDCNLFGAILISLTGAASIYAGHFFTLPLCLMLSAWLGHAPSSRRHCGLQALALAAMLWWAALIFGALEELRITTGIPSFGISDPLRGQNVFLAGMALLGLGLLLASARLVWPAGSPNAAEIRIAPPAEDNTPPTPRREAGDV